MTVCVVPSSTRPGTGYADERIGYLLFHCNNGLLVINQNLNCQLPPVIIILKECEKIPEAQYFYCEAS